MSSRRDALLAASAAEVRRLVGQPIQEATPSRRDFLQYVATQKAELAVIARISPAAPAAMLEYARACDDAEVAALVVTALDDGICAADLRAVANAVTAPLLRDVPVRDASQIYYARLHGADAVLLPAGAHTADDLRELGAIATSLHMAVVVEAHTSAQIDFALQLPRAVIGLHGTTAAGDFDIEGVTRLAGLIPPVRTSIVLAAIDDPATADQLRGIVDAVVVGELLRGPEVASMVARLATGNS